MFFEKKKITIGRLRARNIHVHRLFFEEFLKFEFFIHTLKSPAVATTELAVINWPDNIRSPPYLFAVKSEKQKLGVKGKKLDLEKHWFLIRSKPGNPASPLPEEGKKKVK